MILCKSSAKDKSLILNLYKGCGVIKLRILRFLKGVFKTNIVNYPFSNILLFRLACILERSGVPIGHKTKHDTWTCHLKRISGEIATYKITRYWFPIVQAMPDFPLGSRRADWSYWGLNALNYVITHGLWITPLPIKSTVNCYKWKLAMVISSSRQHSPQCVKV